MIGRIEKFLGTLNRIRCYNYLVDSFQGSGFADAASYGKRFGFWRDVDSSMFWIEDEGFVSPPMCNRNGMEAAFGAGICDYNNGAWLSRWGMQYVVQRP